MIIDNVKKLLEFLKNKPVSVVNNCLDCTKEFALTQVTYSYLAVIAIIAASTPSFIIHSSESNSQISNFQPVIQSTNGQRRPVLRSKVGTLIRVASSSTAQVGKIARYIKPTPENIRDKVPITVILSYSLSRPNYVKFMFSLKAYNVYGQLPLIEASASEDDHVTYGLYADSYTLVRPAIPVLKRQIVEGELYGKALEFVNSLAQRFTEDKEDEDDSTPTLAQEVLEEVMNKSQSASQKLQKGKVQIVILALFLWEDYSAPIALILLNVVVDQVVFRGTKC